jgi:hypothetical protein
VILHNIAGCSLRQNIRDAENQQQGHQDTDVQVHLLKCMTPELLASELRWQNGDTSAITFCANSSAGPPQSTSLFRIPT